MDKREPKGLEAVFINALSAILMVAVTGAVVALLIWGVLAIIR